MTVDDEEIMGAFDNAYLLELFDRFEGGDPNSLFKAIRYCGKRRLVQPEWVVASFHRATNEWYSMRAKTLDEAFGLTWPKGKSFEAARKRRQLSLLVHDECARLIDAGAPIDDHLYETAGKKLNLSGATARRYDKHAREWLADVPGAFSVLLAPYVDSDQNSEKD